MRPGRSKQAARKARGQLHVIVTCSDRKTRPVDPERCIRSLDGDLLKERIADWKHALQESRTSEAVSAADLYSGDQWSVAKSILGFDEAESCEVRLWICSAGYGLLSLKSAVQPYNATFTTGHLDSVMSSTGQFDSGDWWQQLTGWKRRGHSDPRSLRALAQQLSRRPNSFMLVAVSEPYLRAIATDLREAISIGRMRERIAIISVGGKSLVRGPRDDHTASLSNALIPADARLKRRVGGAMQSVNVRLARLAVETRDQWFPDRAELARRFVALSKATRPLDVHRRKRLSDAKVNAYIGRTLRQNSNATASSALRMLRDEGLACEQRRFSTLFRNHATVRARRVRMARIKGTHR